MAVSWIFLLYPLCPLLGWLIGARVKGRPLLGFVWGAALGPPGWLVVLLFYGGAIRCPSCASMTPYAPPLPGAPLLCRRCDGLVEGL